MLLELVVATKNKKKLQEIKAILKGFNLELSSLTDYAKAPRIIENGRTFKENAVKKSDQDRPFQQEAGFRRGFRAFALTR